MADFIEHKKIPVGGFEGDLGFSGSLFVAAAPRRQFRRVIAVVKGKCHGALRQAHSNRGAISDRRLVAGKTICILIHPVV